MSNATGIEVSKQDRETLVLRLEAYIKLANKLYDERRALAMQAAAPAPVTNSN